MRKYFGKIFIVTLILLVTAGVTSSTVDRIVLKKIASVLDDLSHIEFYESLANPSVRYIKVVEGTRKEQIADTLGDKFSWDETDLKDFLGHDEYRLKKYEGKYFPGVYLVSKDISGKEIKEIMNNRFVEKYNNIKSKVSTTTVNTDTVLTIASIIQREAAGKSDMNLISGIIWNRLFEGMPLQMDATLQYAKGNEKNGWWPQVLPADKKIKSPYNTYKNKGLPPAPIANPGIDAINAALNPKKTECIYYIHKNRQIYCSKTYDEHKKNIDLYLK